MAPDQDHVVHSHIPFIYLLRKVHILERTPITVARGHLDIWMGPGLKYRSNLL